MTLCPAYGVWSAWFAVTVMQMFLQIAAPAVAKADSLSETARNSIVYLIFEVTDPKTKAKAAVQGTGFIVSKQGFVLTAAHLFRDWRAQTEVDKASNQIQGSLGDKPGYAAGNTLILQPINIGDPDQEDVALLKLPDPGDHSYPQAHICFSKPFPQVGDSLRAFGFPMGQNFQPVPVTLGTRNAPGGRWAATSPFTFGMSGGPVYSLQGLVFGLVQGGFDTEAVKWITPIRYAKNLLDKADGFSEWCAAQDTVDCILHRSTPGGECTFN
jgi:S1-C subfamily serine protease